MPRTGETDIEEIVAIDRHRILPPCGRGRELLVQLPTASLGTRVVLDVSTATTLEQAAAGMLGVGRSEASDRMTGAALSAL